MFHQIVAASSPVHPRNDTATLVELPDRAVLLAWHRYRASPKSGGDHGQAEICIKRSPDLTLAWGDAVPAIDSHPSDLNVQAPALCRLPSGDLLMACLHAHSAASTTMTVYRSPDAGQTWTPHADVWHKSHGQWLQGGAASLLRLRSGRLLLPFHGGTGTQQGQVNTASCFVSDDEGTHWRRVAPWISLPRRGAMEPSVAELPDGELIMSLRTQLGAVHLSRSVDAGESWSDPVPSGLAAPESCTCLRGIPGTDHLLLLWNHVRWDPTHHHHGPRSPLTMAISRDRGRTWAQVQDLLHDDAFEFTNLNCTFLSNGTAAVTYWACSPAFSRDDSCTSDLRLLALPPSLTGAILERP